MTSLATSRNSVLVSFSFSILALVLLTHATGCGWGSNTPQPPTQPFKGVSIVAAAIADPAILPTMIAQRGEWSADRGAEVTIREAPIDARSTAGVDVILFRGDRLGELVDAGILTNLPESVTQPPAAPAADDAAGAGSSEASRDQAPPTDPLQFNDVAPAYRDQVTKYGGARMGLPYGGSVLVMVYHRDAFELEANREAAKSVALELKPPETWEQFDALAKFFQGRDWDQDGKPQAGVALALGPDPEGVGDTIYLARAASLGQHHDQYSFLFDPDTMAPRLESPPFVEALQGWAKLKVFGPTGIESFNAEAARKAFAGRQAAILIDRAERVASWGEGKGKGIGVAPLPGSERVYNPAPSRSQYEPASPPNRPTYLAYGGGWLVGINAAAKGPKREAAIDFARYLVSPGVANRVRSDPAFPMLAVRSSLLSQGPADPRAALGVDSRQWADAVERSILDVRVLPGLRIPDAEGYLADLAKGRAAVLQGEPAPSALKAVAQAWNERTKQRGLKRQLWHYRRSLNSLTTTPEPPPAS